MHKHVEGIHLGAGSSTLHSALPAVEVSEGCRHAPRATLPRGKAAAHARWWWPPPGLSKPAGEVVSASVSACPKIQASGLAFSFKALHKPVWPQPEMQRMCCDRLTRQPVSCTGMQGDWNYAHAHACLRIDYAQPRSRQAVAVGACDRSACTSASSPPAAWVHAAAASRNVTCPVPPPVMRVVVLRPHSGPPR